MYCAFSALATTPGRAGRNQIGTLADEAMLVTIKQSFGNSQEIYGSPRVHRDLREDGIRSGEKRVARLMKQAQLRSVRGYKRPRYSTGTPATTAPNRLKREFTVAQPDQVWVTDITYIRTYEGWLYLTVVHRSLTGESVSNPFRSFALHEGRPSTNAVTQNFRQQGENDPPPRPEPAYEFDQRIACQQCRPWSRSGSLRKFVTVAHRRSHARQTIN